MYRNDDVVEKSKRSGCSRFVVICGALLGTMVLSLSAAGAVPNPTVTGPIPGVTPGDPSRNYPFFSATADLASSGYVEEEYFISGTANRYSIPNLLATALGVDSGHPYRTRIVVRRPVSQANFNGTVVMEWQNVTAGFDFDAVWLTLQEHLMREGYAWVGVSAQRVGVHQPGTGLRSWSPARYGTLDVTQGGTILDDALMFDIFSQAGQAVRNPQGVDPLNGLQIRRLLASGISQGANRLVSYHNSIHPLAGLFDAFLLGAGGGLLRTDLSVNAFKLVTETDVPGNQAAARQPNSAHFRRWEVAGSAHLDFYIRQQLVPLQARDIGPATPPVCTLPQWSRIPVRYVLNAALDHVVRWVDQQVAPPTAPEIELVSLSPLVIARDSYGNALGGIRLSQHAVPTAANTGLNTGPGFCNLFGSYQPFDEATLHSLYRNHGAYVSRVSNTTEANLQHGFIVAGDAEATIGEAAHSDVGKK